MIMHYYLALMLLRDISFRDYGSPLGWVRMHTPHFASLPRLLPFLDAVRKACLHIDGPRY